MILSMSRQAILFLLTVGIGAVIGLLYDIFRVFRKVAPHRPFMIQLEDLLFWLAVTLLMFYFMLYTNSGEIRLFAILGAVLGMVLYFATVSPLVITVLVAVVNFVKRVIITVLRILVAPLRFLLRLMMRLLAPPCKAVGRFILKRLRLVGRYAKIKAKNTTRAWSIIRKKV